MVVERSGAILDERDFKRMTDEIRGECQATVTGLPRSGNNRGILGIMHSMKQGTHRILTTHVGSLPRPKDLLDLTGGTRQLSEPVASGNGSS